jgi:hypothetical protein
MFFKKKNGRHPVCQGPEQGSGDRANDDGRHDDDDLDTHVRRSSVKGNGRKVAEKDGCADALGKNERNGESFAETDYRKDHGDDGIDGRRDRQGNKELAGGKLVGIYPNKIFRHVSTASRDQYSQEMLASSLENVS